MRYECLSGNHGFSIAPPLIFCYLLKESSAEVYDLVFRDRP
jgi:hypothetical protein